MWKAHLMIVFLSAKIQQDKRVTLTVIHAGGNQNVPQQGNKLIKSSLFGSTDSLTQCGLFVADTLYSVTGLLHK